DLDRSSLYLTAVKICELVSEGTSDTDNRTWVPASFVLDAFVFNSG
ncbi:hypothetical protein HAL1_02430, partial [Halomonas sp. HAL1]